MKSVTSEKTNMVHYQHVGPIGQYHLPKEPRFRFDEKLHRAVSLVPQIEVIDSYTIGREGKHKRVLLKIDGINYCLQMISQEEIDSDGNPISWQIVNHNVKSGKSWRRNLVWQEVYMGDHYYGESSEFNLDITPVSLVSLDNPVTNVVFEYLAVDKIGYAYNKVCRIMIADKEPIIPKNWEVV